MVCHDFPPTMVGGVLRPLKFAKYLPSFGWRPWVLTHRNSSPFLHDEGLLNELPKEAEVVTTEPYVPAFLVRWVRRRDTVASRLIEEEASHAPAASSVESLRRRIWSRAFMWARKYVFVPDRERLWKRTAVAEAGKIFASCKMDALYTTSPPYSVHLIGLAIKRRYGLPWIADFRDQWATNVGFNPFLKNPYRRWREQRMERRVVEAADWVVAVTEPAAEDFRSRYPQHASKICVLPNGFDEADFGSMDGVDQDRDKFRVRSFGSIGSGRRPDAVLQAFEGLRGSPVWRDLEVEFFGLFGYDQKPWREVLKDKVRFVRHIPHAEVAREMRKAGALFVFQCVRGSANFAVPGKLYECGRAGVPVIGVVEGGPTKDIIERYGLGQACYSEDASAIAGALQEAHAMWRRGARTQPAKDFFKVFDRKETTRNLAALLS
jgi:glycosyltransferase involved in cell wall biosynthesis